MGILFCRNRFCQRKMFPESGNSHKRRGVTDKIKRWAAAHPYWLLTFVTLAALMPFLARPFNIDDPLFIWMARQIREHPLNPYGFNAEWGWTMFPMWKVMDNPPFTGYFIALASVVFGWSEIGLHLAFVLPAVAAILGIYRLANKFSERPVLAALLVLFTPVFMVSSLTVMCDVTMMAFWVWAVVFWTEGLAEEKTGKLISTGILIALAEMTKYYGACLIPLLAVHGLVSRRPARRWAIVLLVPVAVLCAYQYATHHFYGEGLLDQAVGYSNFSKKFYGFSKLQNGLIALSFTGGCLASAVFFTPLLWPKRQWTLAAGTMAGLAAAVFSYSALWAKYPALAGGILTSEKIQMVFWATGGVCILALAAASLWRQRDNRSLLLFLWVVGTFIFAGFCNWTINARSILPLAPAVAILVVRQLDLKLPREAKTWSPGIIAGLIASCALAWAVAMSDFSIACATRQSAQEICDKYGSGPWTLWFQGHWGFQYYMEKLGASALDVKNSPLKPGDLIVEPPNNTNTQILDAQKSKIVETFTVTGAQCLATFNTRVGGGFYASAYAPLPFAFGPVPADEVVVYALKFPPAKPPIGNP